MDRYWKFIEKIVKVILDFLLGLFGKKLSENALAGIMQFVKFGVVGLLNTVISYVLYAVSLVGLNKVGFLHDKNYLVAQVIAFVLSVLWFFYWNNKMVFTLEEGKQRSLWRALLKTYISYSFTVLFLNTLLLYLWVDLLGISEYIAPIINLLVSVPVNFVINKFWAFKQKKM